MALRIVALTTPEHRICPYCGSNDVHRSRKRGPIEHVLTFTEIRPYRCHYCERRHLGYCNAAPETLSESMRAPAPVVPQRYTPPYRTGLFEPFWPGGNELDRRVG